MACRGVYFALTDEDTKKLLDAKDDDAVMQVIQEDIEERWDKDWLCEVDKSWDAMHRCLTNGSLNCKGTDPLEKCVLGGKQLHKGNQYIVSFLSPEDVAAISQALEKINKEWFRKKYFGLKKKFLCFDTSDYSPISEEDFEYTWDYFEETREFYKKTASAKRSSIFTVDQ